MQSHTDTLFNPLAPATSERFWAKLSEDRTRFHPLHAHSADVAAVLERLLAPGAPLALRIARTQGADTLDAGHRAALIYLAALHDLGKANHGFQEQSAPRPRARRCGHVKALIQSLECAPLRRAVRDLVAPLGLPLRDAAELFHTAILHHGRPWDTGSRDDRLHPLWQPSKVISRDPIAEIRRLGELALRWSGLAEVTTEVPLRVTPGLTHLFNGALTLADWIASTETAFPFEPDADPETYFWELARGRADEACAAVGVTAAPLELTEAGEALLRRIFPVVFPADGSRAPTRLQGHVASMPLPAPGTRLLVESETGSGKTEAALALYARLRAAGLVGGLVFALPTRATATAMYERVERALEGIYAGQQPSVALAVGGTQPQTRSNRDELEREPQVYDEPEEDAKAAELARWATQNAKRFMAAEIVVGTLDQLLLGALPVKHAHLRVAGLTRHLLVVDELHAYDRYMTGVLRRLLELHTGHGGIALFMSATLADSARREFGGGFEPETTREAAEARPYPALSVCPPGGRWSEVELPSTVAPKQVRWGTCSFAGGLERAADAARGGARVLVLRNTVRGARAAVQALHAAGAGSLLWSPKPGATPAYHSRYAPPDRRALDEAVLGAYGRGKSGGGVILVSTQVAEQSLDVDFDLLVTDLCPVDVLLQRIGRLWRHPERVQRGTVAEASTRVVVPENGIESILASRSRIGPDGWGTVYPDLGDLWLTARLVAGDGEIQIPRDNRRLVEAVYHPDAREALQALPEWDAYVQERDGKDFATVLHARSTALDFVGATYAGCAAKFNAAAEARIRTRLGDDRVRIPLPCAVACRYAPGVQVEFVDLPEGECVKGGVDLREPRVEVLANDANGARFRLAGLDVWYNDDGWQWERRSALGHPAGE